MSSQTVNPDLPSIVCVHGAYHTPKSLEPFLSTLRTAGFDVHAPLLPTCNNAHPPDSSFTEDVAVVRKTISTLVEQQHKRVIVAMHSYGGMPGSEAVDPSLLHSVRKSQGQVGGVVHLFYICSVIAAPPHTLGSVSAQRHVEDNVAEFTDDGLVRLTSADVAVKLFYSDVEDTELVRRTCDTLVPWHIRPVLHQAVKQEPWRLVDATYLRTTKDCGLSLHQQDIMLENIRGKGCKFDVVNWECGHSPFLNKREELAELVKKIAESVSA